MNLLTSVAIYGWVPVVLSLFALLPPRRAVITAFLGAWLFLPVAGFKLAPGMPVIDKMLVTCVGTMVGAFFFDVRSLANLRFQPCDLALVVWVLVPIPSAAVNGYGAYEGMAAAFTQAVAWGLPYLIGRMYFTDAAALEELAIGLIIGGLVYAPLVLFEARMSPQLHIWVYGFHQHAFAQTRRGDGWRPTVFMQHGLAVASFMATAALCGAWLSVSGRARPVLGVPAGWLSAGLFGVTVICRSTYALILLLSGLAALLGSRTARTRAILAALAMIAPAYMIARTVGGWDGQLLRQTADSINKDRSESLGVRLASEDACWRWVQGSVMFGRGRFDGMQASLGREDRFIPDGLWLIAMAKYGLFGLTALYGVLLIPPVSYFLRVSPARLFGPAQAGALVLAVIIILYAMDNLLNAMVNPLYLLAAGGLSAVREAGRPARAIIGPPGKGRP